MKQQHQKGLWHFDERALQLGWTGNEKPPVPTLKEKLWFAGRYIRSNGYGPTFIASIRRLTKAMAFCLKPSQVSWSGKPYVTTGRAIEEDWINSNLTL